jgi:hypothetical protein
MVDGRVVSSDVARGDLRCYCSKDHTDGHNIQPSSHLLSRYWATIQQAHTELHEDGAYEAPKHVAVN